jgi:hypothetical protein
VTISRVDRICHKLPALARYHPSGKLRHGSESIQMNVFDEQGYPLMCFKSSVRGVSYANRNSLSYVLTGLCSNIDRYVGMQEHSSGHSKRYHSIKC